MVNSDECKGAQLIRQNVTGMLVQLTLSIYPNIWLDNSQI